MDTHMNSTLMGRTMLFPCAAGVQVPQIGAEDAKIKVHLGRNQTSNILPMTIVAQDVNPVDHRYVKMVSADLDFSADVIEDRCLHMMPYDTKYFREVFEPGELISVPPKRASSVIGRHDKRGTDFRHMPCNLTKIAKSAPLTPLRKQVKEKARELHKQALLSSQETRQIKSADDDGSVATASSFFMTEVSQQNIPTKGTKLLSIPEAPLKRNDQITKQQTMKAGGKTSRSESAVSFKTQKLSKSKDSHETASEELMKQKNDWDDHLVSRLSKLTANWIVHERMPADKQKEKLANVLESWYGRPAHTDLVREQASDGEEDNKTKDKKPKAKWKKKEASLLERVYNVTPPPIEALDPYSDDNRAPFYRQPAGIRRRKRNEDKEEAGSINATAHCITVPVYQETPPPTLKDILSPRVGDKIYETDNLYQQEWLTGRKQVYQVEGDTTQIVMDTENKYKKQLQREMPQNPETWYSIDDRGKTEGKSTHSGTHLFIPEKGHKRWVALPEIIDATEGTLSASQSGCETTFNEKTHDPKQRRKAKQNDALVMIVHDWRSKWFLSGQFADSTPDDLIKDMADIQAHVRLKAIGTVAKASEYKPPPDNSVLLDSKDSDPVGELPEKIFTALDCLLDDSHEQVRKAAAVTLYSMDRPSDKAKEQLRVMMGSESSVDRWAAAQCLAHYGDGDSDVVAEIIKQILSSEAAIKHEQGICLLAKISNSSTLVHCMVAEQLNSSSWRHRVIACKILPTLFGSINKDITQKLSELMWHDWHVEVRKAASQCLGKTSHGRDVHDDIRNRILNGTERTKMEAINKLGQLGIMTAKLLPAFLECFADPYVSIRCEVCVTCGNLGIKDEQVLDRLVHLATFDPIWKVKALAMQALGKIGVINEDIKETLLWAMRYEEKQGVRAEACHSIMALNIQDDDVIGVLQERLLVESSQIVREEMVEALSVFGLSTSEDMDMVAQIKSEVRKLCTRNIIASQIIVNETDEAKRAQLERMVCQTKQDIEVLNEKKAVILQRIRSQARSTESLGSSPQPRTSTPLAKSKIESESSSPELISREGTVFTPTADKELEAILNQDDGASVSGSADGKSRPATGVSEEAEINEDTELQEKQEGKIHSRITVTMAGQEDEHDGPEKREEYSEGTGRISSQKNSGKEQLGIPIASHRSSNMDMLSPAGLMGDMKRSASKLSVSQFSDRRSVLSRDSMREREKLNREMNSIYTDLNARYADMVQDLVEIDKGLNTKCSSAESSFNATPSIISHTNACTTQLQEGMGRNITEATNVENFNQETGETTPNLSAAPKGVDSEQEVTAEIPAPEQGGQQDPQDDHVQDVNWKKREDVEWKSYADSLSQDNDENNVSECYSTSYPSNDGDYTAAVSYVSTAGYTGQASDYELSDNETEVPAVPM